MLDEDVLAQLEVNMHILKFPLYLKYNFLFTYMRKWKLRASDLKTFSWGLTFKQTLSS